MAAYELWDASSRNLVDYFDTKAELLAALWQMSSYEGLRVACRTSNGKTRWLPALDFAVIVGSHRPAGSPVLP
jgi:hypothetical protein